jgi:hypothetical protein
VATDWTVIEHYERMRSAPPKLCGRLIFGDDAPERQRNSQRNFDPPPLMRYVFDIEEDCNGKKAIQA